MTTTSAPVPIEGDSTDSLQQWLSGLQPGDTGQWLDGNLTYYTSATLIVPESVSLSGSATLVLDSGEAAQSGIIRSAASSEGSTVPVEWSP